MVVKIGLRGRSRYNYLKNGICDEENKYNDGVSWSNEEQVNTHPGDNGNSKVRAIHQADAIHES
jgi:hypothetical protein